MIVASKTMPEIQLPPTSPFQKSGLPPVRLGLAQIKITPHALERNLTTVLRHVQRGQDRGDDILVFPARCLSGSFLGDRFEDTSYLRDLDAANEEIRKASKGIALVWGNFDVDLTRPGHDGQPRVYEAAYVAQFMNWVQNSTTGECVYKTVAANYRGHEDARHLTLMEEWAREQGFTLDEALQPFPVRTKHGFVKLGLTIGNDIWTEHTDTKPATILVNNGADLIVNVSASPWTWQKDRKRLEIARLTQNTAPVPVVTVNPVALENEENNHYPVDGRSFVMDASGNLRKLLPPYRDARASLSLTFRGLKKLKDPEFTPEKDLDDMLDTLLFSAREFFKSGIVAVSGGADSALTLALLCMAIGAENVYGVTMPYVYSDPAILNGAMQLMKNFGVRHAVCPIADTITPLEQQLGALEFMSSDHPANTTRLNISQLAHENIQARERGNRLMALSQMSDHLIVNTANKLEIVFGYGAIHGNWIGALSLIGDLWKYRGAGVIPLLYHINKRLGREMIPESIMRMIPTTELSEDQHQPFFFDYHEALADHWLRFSKAKSDMKSPEAILKSYAAGTLDQDLGLPDGTIASHFPDAHAFIDDLEDKWKRFHNTGFKRNLTPPILVVSPRALGRDHKHSQGAAYFSREYQKLKEKLFRQLEYPSLQG